MSRERKKSYAKPQRRKAWDERLFERCFAEIDQQAETKTSQTEVRKELLEMNRFELLNGFELVTCLSTFLA